MLAHAADRLDLELVALAKPTDTSLLGRHGVVVADPDEPGVLESFAADVDVLTFEHELVDPDALARIEATGVPVRPGPGVLALANKATQRRTLGDLGFPVPPFVVATSRDDVESFAAAHPSGIVVKTATGGYDGRGVYVLDDRNLDGVPEELFDGRQLVVEPRLDIECELAVLVARRPGGESVVYPVVETVQRRGMCREVLVPSGRSASVDAAASEVGAAIADAIGAVGMLAIELFVVDGVVTINELAPRVHNSGHLTIEACVTSQFENQLRAVADLPLGSPELRVPAAAMVNVVGDELGTDPHDHLVDGLVAGDASVHLYAKAPRPERKIGHVTATAADRETARKQAAAVVDALMTPSTPEAR